MVGSMPLFLKDVVMTANTMPHVTFHNPSHEDTKKKTRMTSAELAAALPGREERKKANLHKRKTSFPASEVFSKPEKEMDWTPWMRETKEMEKLCRLRLEAAEKVARPLIIMGPDIDRAEIKGFPISHRKSKQEYRKENKMSWFPKILRRVIVLWCLYGLVRLVLLAHPHVVRLALVIRAGCPDYGSSRGDAVITTWILLLSGTVLFAGATYVVHVFSRWLFNERK